jgi:hypothetical protein
MFGLVNLVISAERDSREKNRIVHVYDWPHIEPPEWLWRHKVALIAAGVLALFIVGNGG